MAFSGHMICADFGETKYQITYLQENKIAMVKCSRVTDHSNCASQSTWYIFD
jgi:hypothetical protein